MHLVSQAPQRVALAGEQIHFGKGEFVTTEYSYKYREESFRALAAGAGWQAEQTWVDERHWFSVHYFRLQNFS